MDAEGCLNAPRIADDKITYDHVEPLSMAQQTSLIAQSLAAPCETFIQNIFETPPRYSLW